jgi:hypothetical protein
MPESFLTLRKFLVHLRKWFLLRISGFFRSSAFWFLISGSAGLRSSVVFTAAEWWTARSRIAGLESPANRQARKPALQGEVAGFSGSLEREVSAC